jgi:argininosuccinate synthase
MNKYALTVFYEKGITCININYWRLQMENKNYKKIVLAYSGGLDTSIIIPWLKENYNNPEIIAVSADVGQGTELEGLEEKALKTGASKLYILDLKEEFVQDYIYPTLKAGAVYEQDYLLGTSFARPLIGKELVKIAKSENADAICHGCTGKGNDQVRFELAIKAFAPNLAIIAPWRTWEIKSRNQEIQYAEDHNIPLKINKETSYSKDKNIWHLSHEGLDLENPANEPTYEKDDFLEMCVSPLKAPDKPTAIELEFVKGIPTKLNGKKLNGVQMIEALNKVGGENGIGIVDVVENRLVGMKSRGVYETPGGTILYKAHQVLETITLDKDTQHYKYLIAQKYSEIVYNGTWFTVLREALDSFVDKTQELVSGTVKFKLYKGNIINAGVESPYSLYDENIATFDEDQVYDQNDSAGFINLFGLPIKVKAQMEIKNNLQ